MEMNEDEEALLGAFIVRGKRARYIELLGNKKRRAQVTDGLNHCQDLDPRYSTPVPSAANIVSLLRAKGAPDTCCVISDIRGIDGRKMALQEAVDIIEREGWGTLLGCIPGRLAYYYGEEGEQRLILEKT
jgi:hypothetical protein